MRNVYFGFALQYDDGIQTNVAMNQNGVIVEVHKSDNADTLWCHVGHCNKATVDWGGSVKYDDGITPSCAVNIQNKVVEVHQSSSKTGLWYHVGTVSGNNIQWSSSRQYDTGTIPCVAMNDSGVVVEVHRSSSETKLCYHVGSLSGDTVNWSDSRQYDTGDHPSVDINNQGIVVEVHKSEHNNGLWYHVGQISGNSIDWGPSIEYDSGINPSVALTDDGFVIEVHESEHAVSTNFSLWRRVGEISGTTIEWIGGAADFDNGAKPSVACGGNRAIQTHQSENANTLWFSTSLIADRSSWMQDSLQVLQDKTLKQLALPASHDSGMYKGDCGHTQYKDLYDQLSYGIRYFDLRPDCGGVPPVFSIHHGVCTGPYLSKVLADIALHERRPSRAGDPEVLPLLG